jgi:hypothetical protein
MTLKRPFGYSPKKPVQQSKRLRVYGKATEPSYLIESDPIRGSSPAAYENSLDLSDRKPSASSSAPNVQFAPRPVFRILGQHRSLKATSQSSVAPPAKPTPKTPQATPTSMAPPPSKPLSVPCRNQAQVGRQLTGQVLGGQNVASSIPSRYPRSNNSRYSTSTGQIRSIRAESVSYRRLVQFARHRGH